MLIYLYFLCIINNFLYFILEYLIQLIFSIVFFIFYKIIIDKNDILLFVYIIFYKLYRRVYIFNNFQYVVHKDIKYYSK